MLVIASSSVEILRMYHGKSMRSALAVSVPPDAAAAETRAAIACAVVNTERLRLCGHTDRKRTEKGETRNESDANRV